VNHRTVRKLLDRYQKILGLSEWDIKYEEGEEPPVEGAIACIIFGDQGYKAYLYIGGTENLEASILHELLHLMFAHNNMFLGDLMEEYVNDQVSRRLIAGMLDNNEERIVYRLTKAFMGILDA
jgi:hypothetical protein